MPTLDSNGNAFFVISSVKPHEGAIGRKTEHFDALHVVVLDDIGTKAELPLLAPVSTYTLETSPGNCQVGFRLDPPCSDLAKIERLYSALTANGWSDKGAQGPQSRYVRLPVGVNLKPSNGPGGFRHLLREWHPGVAYSIDDLAQKLGIDLSESPAPKVRDKPAPTRSPAAPAPAPARRGASQAGGEQSDAEIIASIKRTARGLAVWNGAEESEGDKYLLTRLAYRTADPTQIERIYSASPRADRVSSDGTRKWQSRRGYREDEIATSLAYAEQHPDEAGTEAAAEVVDRVVREVEADPKRDTRRFSDPAFLAAMGVLEARLPADASFWRSEIKKLGLPVGVLRTAIRALLETGPAALNLV